jgi:hypothetical protein
MKLPVHPTIPQFESKIVDVLTSGGNVLAVLGEDTYKYFTTDIGPTPTEPQALRVFKSEDSKGKPHYLLITTVQVEDEKYKEYKDAIIITPLEELMPKDLKVVNLTTEVDDRIFQKYKEYIHRIQ